MRLVVSQAAADLVEERGGRLYVWVTKTRCCGGGMRTLATSSERPTDREFRLVPGDQRFELFLAARLGQLPDELHLDLRRFPRRVEAYWNGCAWMA
jgi:hypothetical protein